MHIYVGAGMHLEGCECIWRPEVSSSTVFIETAHLSQTLIIWLVGLASLLWDLLFLSYEAGITGGPPPLTSIDVGPETKLRSSHCLPISLTTEKFPQSPPMLFFSLGSSIFFSNHGHSHCAYQHASILEPLLNLKTNGLVLGKAMRKKSILGAFSNLIAASF